MIRVLVKRRSGLKIVHINAQSMRNKIEEMRYLFNGSDVDVICISETWLWPKFKDSLFSLDNYQLFRADRGTLGGGVAMYIRKGISCKVKMKSNFGDSLEFIFVEISNGTEKLLIGTVYRPNNRTNYDILLEKLDLLCLDYTSIILCGDFNCNVLSDNSIASEMQYQGLNLVNSIYPTHYSHVSNSLIDLFFVSSLERTLLYDQLSAPMFSRHDLCFLTFDFKINKSSDIIYYRDFKNINFNSLHQDLLAIDWDSIFYILSVDGQLEFLQNNVNKLFSKYVPLRTKIIKNLQCPWIDNEVIKLMDLRNIAFARWKRFKIPEFRRVYTNLRNSVTATIRLKKKSYLKYKFDNALNSRQTWKQIHSLGLGKQRTNIDENGAIDVEQLNSNFINYQSPEPNYDLYNRPYPSTNLPISSLEFTSVTQLDVLQNINKIKSNAIGSDDVNPKFLKIIIPYILPYITHVFNSIITKSYFPKSWKIARIIPTPKNTTEYRPIAILPFLSKAFERIINYQIMCHIRANNLMSKFQSGFREKHSCITALQKVSEDLRSNLDSNKVSFLVLLDHSKAFDTVDHKILCSKLQNLFNFSSTSGKLVNSYLSLRFQFVSVGDRRSALLPVNRGVPQGSVLGPLLYSLYSNDLPTRVQHSNIHMYADDVQVYISSPTTEIRDCILHLNADLAIVNSWAKSNGLNLNPSKSKCVVISRQPITLPEDIPVKISDSLVNIVCTARNLGVVFDNKLSWSDHIKSVIGRSQALLRNLYVLQKYTPIKIRLLLAKSFLVPTLLYGCELFSSCKKDLFDRLKVAFNNISRYVFGLDRRAHITEFSNKILGVTFENFLNIRCLLSMHKIIYTQTPHYLYECLQFARSYRGKQLIQIKHSRTISNNFFFISTICLWNNLPFNIQLISNDRQFKSALFEHFKA